MPHWLIGKLIISTTITRVFNENFALPSDSNCYYAAQRGEIKMFVQKKTTHLREFHDWYFLSKLKRRQKKSKILE